jgi:His/Glu/Gln/Arg/opine family amino acid ABC transporter permease subunit
MEHIMIILSYIPLLLQGAAMTIAAWITATIISLCIGLMIGIASCRYLTCPFVSTITTLYTFIAKGIPAYVQILIVYFVIPALTGINLSGFVAATCALGFCSSGYVTEIVRSNINNIPQGQWDACAVLGYSLRSTLTQIILPQAMINALPTLLGELEQLLKSTSLLATIGVLDVTRAGINIISREMNPITVYTTIACIYLFFSLIARCCTTFLEKRITYGYR